MRFGPVLSLLVTPFLMGTAWSGEIVLELGGVSFEGGAAFSVTLGNAPIGSGTIAPEGEERQWFGFEVADDTLRAGGDLTISFTNDLNLGPDQDRSLLVFSARAGSYTLYPDQLLLVNALSGEQIARDREPALPLWTNDEVAVALSPRDGWIAAEAPAPAVAAGSVDCGSSIRIDGFAINGVALTPQQLGVLSAEAAGPLAAGCRVQVVGYASLGGGDEVNRIISLARAEAVGDALRGLGGAQERLEVISGGATSEFGPAAGDNRIVVLRFLSPDGSAETAESLTSGARTMVLTLGRNDEVEVRIEGQVSRPEQLWMLEMARTRLLRSAGE